jgi:hypothetical protein
VHATVQQPCTVDRCTVVCAVNFEGVKLVEDWLIDHPPWRALAALPPGYRRETDVLEESRITLAVLMDVCIWAARGYSNQRLPGDASRIPFSQAFPLLLPRPGITLDSSGLREAFIELRRLGLLGADETSGGTSISKGVFTVHVIRKVSSVLRGYIEHIETIPLRDDPRVAQFLQINGLSDVLARDHHGVVGWHYHYCDRDGKRSDTMLSFDTNQPRQIQNGEPTPLKDNAPLFWERHSESHAKFDARADRWGSKKRKSVFKAAQPDLGKWKSTDFRRPATNAQPVWPEGATLSPPPAALRSS